MTTNIKLLPDHIINQIAAGEVIESPASVIKELVENALDAKASSIEIEIKAGGMLLLRVTDNGKGMSRDDLQVCLLRHATSKIKAFEDLQSVSTMGFRGEALASIAAISKMRIESAKNGEGHSISKEGVKVTSFAPCARSCGTQVEVKSLFFNVPVRKNFQKSITSLTSETVKVINKLSLANPSVCFTLISEDKPLIDVKASSDSSFKGALQSRIKDVLGVNILDNLRWVEHREGHIYVQGFIGAPLFSKKHRMGQYLFINGRVVISDVISSAIKEGYATRLDEKQYPIYILHVTSQNSSVDVNVHPQKKYVRLSNQQHMRHFLQKAVNSSFERGEAHPNSVCQPSSFFSNEESTTDSNMVIEASSFSSKKGTYNADVFEEYKQNELFSSFRKMEEEKIEVSPLAIIGRYCLLDFSNDSFVIFNKISEKIGDNKDLPSGLLAIDLKAASSTIFFEEVMDSSPGKNNIIDKQILSIPIVIDLMKEEVSLLEKHIDIFLSMGFDLRIIAEDAIAVDATTFLFKSEDLASYLLAILEELETYGKSEAAEKIVNKKIAQKICRVIRSRKTMYLEEEAKKIIEMLFRCKNPYHDPLGAPTIIVINDDDLSKLFLNKRGI